MRNYVLLHSAIVLLIIFSSCNSGTNECEQVQEWKVQNYRIVKSKCPDLVLANYFTYSVYVGDKEKGSAASQVDSCRFTWQADHESFITLNVCANTIQQLTPNKITLDLKAIDSVTIYSKELNRTQELSRSEIEKIVHDWNNSRTRGYSDNPFDSAFSVFPAYQYKLTVFSKGDERNFYGYNYLILDSSNWEYEMSKSGNLDYFHNFWIK